MVSRSSNKYHDIAHVLWEKVSRHIKICMTGVKCILTLVHIA